MLPQDFISFATKAHESMNDGMNKLCKMPFAVKLELAFEALYTDYYEVNILVPW